MLFSRDKALLYARMGTVFKEACRGPAMWMFNAKKTIKVYRDADWIKEVGDFAQTKVKGKSLLEAG